ncbi:Lipoate synthase [uncultured Gammaproteobacteria bacterium]|nr:Lipoate synthase [uncultured Gammaproteobacteria bacterium]
MSQEVEIRALKGKSKVSRLKIKPDAKHLPLRKPQWIRIKHLSGSKVDKLKNTLREQNCLLCVKKHNAPTLVNALIMVRRPL